MSKEGRMGGAVDREMWDKNALGRSRSMCKDLSQKEHTQCWTDGKEFSVGARACAKT